MADASNTWDERFNIIREEKSLTQRLGLTGDLIQLVWHVHPGSTRMTPGASTGIEPHSGRITGTVRTCSAAAVLLLNGHCQCVQHGSVLEAWSVKVKLTEQADAGASLVIAVARWTWELKCRRWLENLALSGIRLRFRPYHFERRANQRQIVLTVVTNSIYRSSRRSTGRAESRTREAGGKTNHREARTQCRSRKIGRRGGTQEDILRRSKPGVAEPSPPTTIKAADRHPRRPTARCRSADFRLGKWACF